MNLNFEIKPLNEQQYSEAPEAVRRVYISVLENIPLSTQELKTTIKAYPDYFRLKSTEKPKTFGQKVKRLFNLKNHLTKERAKMVAVTGTIQKPSPGEVNITGTITNPEAIAQVKRLRDSLPPNAPHPLVNQKS